MSKKFTTAMIVTAVSYFVFGLILIIWPEQSRLAICYLLGAALVLYGGYRIIAYFAKPAVAEAMQFGVAIGLASVVMGILLLVKANMVVAVFGMIVGIALLVDSILRMQIALDIRRMGGAHWGPVCICAGCMLAVGILLLLNPFKVVTTATILSGVALLIDGGLTIWSLVETKGAFKNATAPTKSRVK